MLSIWINVACFVINLVVYAWLKSPMNLFAAGVSLGVVLSLAIFTLPEKKLAYAKRPDRLVSRQDVKHK